MIPVGHSRKAPVLALVLAFAAIYLLWGSTYLAIRIAIDTIPPLIMAGVRFFAAGLGMYLVLRWRGVPRPSLAQWRSALIIGGLFFLTANGTICWAEKIVPSGLTALLVATVPLWMALLDWLVFGGRRPTVRTVFGLTFGLGGILVLVNPSSIIGQPLNLPATLAIIGACLSWAIGSLYSRSAPLPKSVFLATGMELIGGGVLLLISSMVFGEWKNFDVGAVTMASVWSVLYLLTLGSIIAFTAYVWLLNHVSAAAVSTYAFVNPIVALLLGWLLGNEPLGPRALLAAALILAAVMLITLRRNGARAEPAAIKPSTPVTREHKTAIEREPCKV